MKDGNWVPIAKGFVCSLPKDRAFSRVEAIFSLQVDYDCARGATVLGLSKRWMWKRKKVRGFLQEIGISIEKEEPTSRTPGKLVFMNNLVHEGAHEGAHERFIDSKDSQKSRAMNKAMKGINTINTNTKNKYSDDFEVFWKKYPRKVGKEQASKVWKKLKPTRDVIDKIIGVIECFAESEGWQKDDGQYIPHPQTWLRGRRWEDELPKQRTGQSTTIENSNDALRRHNEILRAAK